MYRPTRKHLLLALLAGALLFGFGVWVLLHPASIFVQPWRAQTTASSSSEVIFGPYPVEADFVDLQRRGVTTIISLLEPRVPYEAKLLDEERERAARHGMQVLNFPMGSILGQKFGKDYVANSRAAAEAALHAKGIAYIHCYLGLHRARYVQDYINQFTRSSNYAGSNTAVPAADLDAEHDAQNAYDAGDFRASLAALARIRDKRPRAARLEGWSHYRLREIPEARAAFEAVLRQDPDDGEARSGLGYATLAAGDVDRAAGIFAELIAKDADDASSIEGLAFARNRQGRRDEARALLQRAVALDPANSEIREMLEKMQPDDERD